MSISKTQLIGGHFQDAKGNLLAGGSLKFRLSQDAVTNDHANQITAGVELTFALDVNGDVFGTQVADTPKSYIWGNDDLLPATTSYIVTAYTASGQLAWSNPQIQQVISGATFSLSTWIPNLVPLANSSSSVSLQHNGSLNSSQAVLNLVDGTNTTVVDNGSGSLQINTSSASVTPTSISGGSSGGASEVLMQESTGAAVTVRRLTGGDVAIATGSLSASAAKQTSSLNVNLSTQGTFDWTYLSWAGGTIAGSLFESGAFRPHWKLLNGRLLSSARILDNLQLGFGTSTGHFTYSSNVGDDASSGEAVANLALSSRTPGFYMFNNNTLNFPLYWGYQFRDIPLPDMSARTLKFYVMISSGSGTLTARLSDGSAADATVTVSEGLTNTDDYVITVNVTPGSVGARLNVTWVVTANSNSPSNAGAILGCTAVTMA